MPWSTHATHETTAGAAAIWARWVDPDLWPLDDPGCRSATIDGPVAMGSTGRVKTAGPAQKFTFVEVEPLRSMIFEIALPFARMRFPHRIEAVPGERTLRVTHGVTIEGRLAPLWGYLIGRRLARGLPEVLRNVTANACLAGADA